MEYTEKNVLIAMFMGAELTVPSQGIYLIPNTMERDINGELDHVQKTVDELKYDLDWRWLMPVVSHIENAGYEFFIVENRVKIAHNTDHSNEVIMDFTGKDCSKMDAVYEGVVKFIEWHNKIIENVFLFNQIKLQREIVEKAGINIVTCGNCGAVMLHRTDVEELECPFCKFKDEISSFPDLFFEHY